MVEYGNQSITCKLCGVNQELTWYLTAVYASCDRNKMMELREELGTMKSLCEGPWVVCGDFNITRFPSKKTNCIRLSRDMIDMSSCINELELIDLLLFGTLGEQGQTTRMPPGLIDFYTRSHGMKCSFK